MDSWKRFKEESFPNVEFCYDTLNSKPVTNKERTHALKIWDTFKIKKLR